MVFFRVVEKAEAQLVACLKWRTEFKVAELNPDMFELEASTGKLYRHGFDKTGRPVLYMKPRLENTKNWDNQLRHTVYHLERTVESMDPARGVESWVFIMDFSGHSLSTSAPMSLARQILDIISTSYPERLGLSVMVDTPFFFSLFWGAISPFVPPVTKAKVKFCSSPRNGYKLDPSFSNNFDDLDDLESDFGGTKTYEYDHQVYWDNERQNLSQLKKVTEA